jgi:hypothetical protein
VQAVDDHHADATRGVEFAGQKQFSVQHLVLNGTTKYARAMSAKSCSVSNTPRRSRCPESSAGW